MRAYRVFLVVAWTAAVVGLLVGFGVVGPGGDDDDQQAGGGGRAASATAAWDPRRQRPLEQSAALGLAHVLYAKSPGGAVATAERTNRFRPMIEEVAQASDLDADVLEAIVFLESAGRPDARASDDLEGAVGLTQILAETGQNLLEMRVDVAASERLTRGIQRGRRVAARERERRRVDERFDPRKALEGTARYLKFAEDNLDGRGDLAVASYHMGVGNLQRALKAYGKSDVPYAQLYFDSSPITNAKAWDVLSGLGDDSSTYLWRVYAARSIMATWRHSPAELANIASQHLAKNSAEEVLHPPSLTKAFEDAGDVEAAPLQPLVAPTLREHGLQIDPQMGELAARVGATKETYRRLQPGALALLLGLGDDVRELSGDETSVLRVTSSVRDERYQRALLRSCQGGEATRGYSLHTTGWAFDIARDYTSRRQAVAFQFWLDRMTALNKIAWVREPGAIHITVARS